MKINIEITEKELKQLILDEFEDKTGQQLDSDRIRIMVKSKQNYKSEWESASFKATYEGDI